MSCKARKQYHVLNGSGLVAEGQGQGHLPLPALAGLFHIPLHQYSPLSSAKCLLGALFFAVLFPSAQNRSQCTGFQGKFSDLLRKHISFTLCVEAVRPSHLARITRGYSCIAFNLPGLASHACLSHLLPPGARRSLAHVESA